MQPAIQYSTCVQITAGQNILCLATFKKNSLSWFHFKEISLAPAQKEHQISKLAWTTRSINFRLRIQQEGILYHHTQACLNAENLICCLASWHWHSCLGAGWCRGGIKTHELSPKCSLWKGVGWQSSWTSEISPYSHWDTCL